MIEQPIFFLTFNRLQYDVHLMKCNRNIIYAIMQWNISALDYPFLFMLVYTVQPHEPVVPVHNAYTICLSLWQVIGQVITDPSPEQRWDASHGRQMVLVNVIQHLVIQGDQVLQLWLWQTTLSSSDVGKCVEHEDATMLRADRSGIKKACHFTLSQVSYNLLYILSAIYTYIFGSPSGYFRLQCLWACYLFCWFQLPYFICIRMLYEDKNMRNLLLWDFLHSSLDNYSWNVLLMCKHTLLLPFFNMNLNYVNV